MHGFPTLDRAACGRGAWRRKALRKDHRIDDDGWTQAVSDEQDRPGFGDGYWRTAATPSDELAPLTGGGFDQSEYERLADNLPTLCWIAGPDGYIVWYNRRWHSYCGTTPEDMEGWGWQSVHDPDILPSVMTAWTDAITQGVPFEMVFPLRGADGVFRPFLTRIVPLRDADGVVQRWIGNNVDISEQRRIETELRDSEEALRALAQTLEARVEERTRLHEATQDELRQSQKLEAVGQLTGGVAHDFNNLLTVIKGSVDLLRRDGVTDEKRRRYVEAIGTTADRAAKLTGQLLAFARRQALRPVLFDAGASLDELRDIVTTLAGSRIAVAIDIPADRYFIVADRSQFDTAIVNIAVNARDAMPKGGRLSITTGPVSGIPAIRSHDPVSGDFVAVTIGDTGEGIAATDIGRIFEPFFTTKQVGEGTGLGLSQVIGFAKQSGGDIRVDSAPGVGTTFTLYLPRAQPADDRVAADEDAGPTVAGEGACVLVVEDNDQVGSFATQALRELGYDSVLALDAKAALAELERGCDRFHIVFSDVVMPGMSGIELGATIRRLYPDVPVVLTSGYSHVLAQNGQHGFELLHKPYSIEQLSRVLRKAITWQSRRRAAPPL